MNASTSTEFVLLISHGDRFSIPPETKYVWLQACPRSHAARLSGSVKSNARVVSVRNSLNLVERSMSVIGAQKLAKDELKSPTPNTLGSSTLFMVRKVDLVSTFADAVSW